MLSAPDAGRSAATGLATFFLSLRSTPLDTFARLRYADALVVAGSPHVWARPLSSKIKILLFAPHCLTPPDLAMEYLPISVIRVNQW